MARPTSRRTIRLEQLEDRLVMSSGGPSAEAQYMLEVVNLVRTQPTEGAEWVEEKTDATIEANLKHYNVDLNSVLNAVKSAQPREPLAWNDELASAAQGQSEDMARNGFQSHTGSDGRDLNARLDAVGYKNRTRSSENAFAYATSIDNAMQAFLIDWGVADAGHRRNIQDVDVPAEQTASELGIGIADGSRSGVGPKVVTQNFGSRAGAKAQLLGVVYDDLDGDGRYSMNEGTGGATIEVKNVANGATKTVENWNSGGYQVELDPGTYTVAARTAGKLLGGKTVTIGSQNAKVDFNLKTAPTITAAKSTPVMMSSKPEAPVTKPAPRTTTVVSNADRATPESLTNATASSGLFEANWSVALKSINWGSSWGAK